MSGIEISRCAECAWQGTPRRLWCPACGGHEIENVVATAGVVKEVTTVRHTPGGDSDTAPVEVASIDVDGGGTLIARHAPGRPGVTVLLADDGGAPVATPAEGDET